METIHYRTPKKTTTVANVPVIDLYGTDLTTGDEKRGGEWKERLWDCTAYSE